MKRFAALVLLLSVSAFADCPFTVPCPYDGDPMQNTWNCKGVGAQRACEFSHSKLILESGKNRTVVHKTWASCPS